MLWYCLFFPSFSIDFSFIRILFRYFFSRLFFIFFFISCYTKKFHHHLHLIIFHLFSCVTSMFLYMYIVAANNNKRSLPIYSSSINIHIIFKQFQFIVIIQCYVFSAAASHTLRNMFWRKKKMKHVYFSLYIKIETFFVRYEFMSNINGCSSEELNIMRGIDTCVWLRLSVSD